MQHLRVCLLRGRGSGINHKSFVKHKCQLLSCSLGKCHPGCHSYSQHIYSLRKRKLFSCERLYTVKEYSRVLDVHVPFGSHSVFSQDTIYALSSGHGKCGVALIRVTGTKAKDVLLQIGQFSKMPQARMAKLRKLQDPETKEVIDVGLVVWFPGPHSFTGEDCVEFQVHGGSAVVVAMMDLLAKFSGLRPAEAGEFTKRAFMNGKLDLTEVEGLADLIHAETEAQRKQAIRQMQGDLSKLYNDWRARLIQYTAMLEAFIDFSEDENIEEDVVEEVSRGVTLLLKEIQHHLQDNRRGERLREGVHVAIVGQPNVGKSSLLNSICQRPAAIVSPTAGTTRDLIETAVNIGDFPVLLSDTAGLRETSDDVEKEGVRRALSRAKEADILILMLEAPFISYQMQSNFNFTEFIHKHLYELGIIESSSKSNISDFIQTKTSILGSRSDSTPLTDDCHEEERLSQVYSFHDNLDSAIDNAIDIENIFIIFNKCDLVKNQVQKLKDIGNHDNSFTVCTISCVSGEGYDSFLQILKEKVQKMCGNPLAGNPSLTQARHRSHLSKCLERLKVFQDYMEKEDFVLAAEALRRALREVGKITGRVTTEDILDVIFRDFCIGK